MIELSGIASLIYTFFKDARSYVFKKRKLCEKEKEYKHESKLVMLNDNECLRVVKMWEQEGYTVRWVFQHQVASEKRDGCIVLQEKDEQNRIIYDVFVKNSDRGIPDNLIPIGKKNS